MKEGSKINASEPKLSLKKKISVGVCTFFFTGLKKETERELKKAARK